VWIACSKIFKSSLPSKVVWTSTTRERCMFAASFRVKITILNLILKTLPRVWLPNFRMQSFLRIRPTLWVITAACLSVALIDNSRQIDLEFQWKQLFGKDAFCTSLLVACVLICTHFSLEFSCFISSCFILSTFHP